jgi:hypothetical protein
MFRRETIIALRARHQAHRIASDILNPHVDTPPPPQPAMPVDPPDWRAPRAVDVRSMLIAAALIWGLVAAYWLTIWLARGSF